MQREIQNAAFAYQREIETRQRIIVGVNQFTAAAEAPQDILRVNPRIESRQKERLERVRAQRSATDAKAALAKVESAARDGGNLMPPIVDAVRAYATLGEIADAMRRVFGEYHPASEF
jgi:methylmalonyl-CoA mutase N-terminal domain/subunit